MSKLEGKINVLEITKNTLSLIRFLDKKGLKDYEIIIGNNGSTDKTSEKGEALSKKFPKMLFKKLLKSTFNSSTYPL